jgi:hypothetical protein
MALAGPGSTIWLDALSINQSDHQDVTSQVAVMGDIYGNAECVSVLLPSSDREAYQTISDIVSKAKTLLGRKGQFDYNPEDDKWKSEPAEEIKVTGELARSFFTDTEKLQSDLIKYVYWRRAWTFQEWARAHDVEMAVEEPQDAATILPTLQKVKSTIVYAAIMIANYKLRFGQYALMDLGFSRGLAKTHLDKIKRLFPFEDAFASPDEICDSELRFQTAFPNLGTNAILGLRSSPRAPRTATAQFRARLSLMLDAFAGSNKRQATFQADLVCCWASMCNIAYDYSKDDTLETALLKVIRTLRQRGITVYNFLVTGQQDIDLQFFKYAAAHQQYNATNNAYLPGLPVFTGCADTTQHFHSAVMLPELEKPTLVAGALGSVGVRMVIGARINIAVPLSNRQAAVSALHMASSGLADGMMFTDVLDDLVLLLHGFPNSHLENRMLVIASVPTGEEASGSQYFQTWAVCPSTAIRDREALFIAREELNGTLVLARRREEDSSNQTSIVAYLTLTDQQSGTFLIPVSPEGQITLMLKTPQRSDIVNSKLQSDRQLRANLTFAEDNTTARTPGPESPLVLDSPQAFKQLLARAGHSGFGTNDAVIQTVGEEVSTTLLRELVTRMELGSEKSFERDGKGKAPLKIDIGHPELVPEEQQDAERVRYHAGLRRSSI